MKTCSAQEPSWWSDGCTDCGHLIAAHRNATLDPADVPEGESLIVPYGECAFCTMQKQLEDAMEVQSIQLRSFAEGLNEKAQEFATDLQDKAKTYIDEENQRFAGVAKQYVDTLRKDATTAIQDNTQAANQLRTDTTNAIQQLSQAVTGNQTAAKTYIDAQIPAVIIQRVKPEALR